MTFITERSKLITELAHGPRIVNLVPLAGISIESEDEQRPDLYPPVAPTWNGKSRNWDFLFAG